MPFQRQWPYGDDAVPGDGVSVKWRESLPLGAPFDGPIHGRTHPAMDLPWALMHLLPRCLHAVHFLEPLALFVVQHLANLALHANVQLEHLAVGFAHALVGFTDGIGIGRALTP